MVRSSKKVWVIVLTILGVLAIFAFLRSPFFNVRTIVIQGNSLVSSQELLALVNVGVGVNIFQVSTGDIVKNVSLHPLVKAVEVSRKLPNTLVISIVERKPVAMIPVKNGFVKVDEQGVFLQRSDVWPKQPMPIISGIQLPENLNLGQAIPNPALLEALKLLLQLPKDLYSMVGELSAANRDALVMYTRDGLEIRLGGADQAQEKFSLLDRFLQDKTYKPYRVGYYLDLTSGKPVLGKR